MLRSLLSLMLLWLAACQSSPEVLTPIPAPVGPEGPKLSELPLPVVEVEAAEDYTLGPRDVVRVRVADLERPGEHGVYEREVTPVGRIHLPFAGELAVRGQTTSELRDGLRQTLSAVLVDPRVSVEIAAYRSKRVHVMGQVKTPGMHPIPRNQVDVLEALALADGLRDSARRSAVLVHLTRARTAEQYLIDLEQLLTRGSKERAIVVEPGDTLSVPKADQIYALGYVKAPGAYPLDRQLTALELVGRAGGWIEGQASPSYAILRRRAADGSADVLEVDLEAIRDGDARDYYLAPGDTLYVPQTNMRALRNWLGSVVTTRIPGPSPLLN